MVSKTDLGLLALAGFAIFLIVRGGGQFLSKLGNPLGGLELPSLPAINLDFSNFNPFPNRTSDEPVNLSQPDLGLPNPADSPTDPTPIDVFLTETPLTDTFERAREVESMLTDEERRLDPNRDPNLFNPPSNVLGIDDRRVERGDISVPVAEGIATAIGGGPSFIGGQISEIPISRLSLSDIIDRFGVSATEAADIHARARDDFGSFDFGSSTGRGIGSVLEDPEIRTRIDDPRSNVSNSEFQGLSLTEIALRLTGGNISNF